MGSLPFFLGMTLNTPMISELARVYCKRTTIKLHYLECLYDFLDCTLFADDCWHANYVHRLELSIWPPYWDLDVFPPRVSTFYNLIAAEYIKLPNSLLEIETRGAKIKLVVNFRAECGCYLHVGNSKFDRWLVAMIPLFRALKERGFEIDLVQFAISRRSTSRRRHVNALFEHPAETWLWRIEAGQLFVSPHSFFAKM